MNQSSYSCRFPTLTWYRDAELPEPVANLVLAHIAECKACDLEIAGEMVVSQLLRRVEFESAPSSLQLRIRTQITQISTS